MGSGALAGPPAQLSRPLSLRRTLADIIMEKLTEKKTEVESVMSEVSGLPLPRLNPRLLEVYRGVREVRAESRAVMGPTGALGAHIFMDIRPDG